MVKNILNGRMTQGSHCFSTAITRITNYYYDDKFDEDLCFGLGSGLGFMYRREADMVCLNGRANDIEKMYADNMGIKYKQYSFKTFEEFVNSASSCIKNNNWLLLYLDASQLSYINLGLDMQDINMMSEHAAILVGVDTDIEVFYIYDYMSQNEILITYEQLYKALYNECPEQFSMERSSNLRNTYAVFEFPCYKIPLELAVYYAIDINCNNFMNPTNRYQGIQGMRYFVREFPLWKELMEEKRFKQELAASYSYLEKIGTGGGNFRRLYARFLLQVSSISGNEEFADLSKNYFKLSRMWKTFSINISKLSETYSEPLYDMQKELIKKIYDEEFRMILALQKCVTKG